MPNWKQIVPKKLRVLEICSAEFTEELAAHLEDSYEALRCEGLPAEVAFQHTIGQIEGGCRVWLVMRFLQEELMTGFITKVALPGLLTSAVAGSFHWVLALDHIPAKVAWLATRDASWPSHSSQVHVNRANHVDIRTSISCTMRQ